MLRNRGTRRLELLRDVAGAHFAALQQGEDRDPPRFGEGFENALHVLLTGVLGSYVSTCFRKCQPTNARRLESTALAFRCDPERRPMTVRSLFLLAFQEVQHATVGQLKG